MTELEPPGLAQDETDGAPAAAGQRSTPAPIAPRRRLAWPAWILACAVLGALLRLPALRAQLYFDDFILASMIRGDWSARGPLDLDVFASGTLADHATLLDRGLIPWWLPSDYRAAPFRPLASLLIWIEYALLGANPGPLHAAGLLWWAALAASAAALFRRALGARAGALALLFYCVAPAHAVPSVWVAAQSAWMATIFAVLTVWAFLRLRDEGWERGRWATPALLAGGLLSGEYAIGALGFMVAYELCVARDGARARLRAWGPILATLVIYAVAYRALGRGGHAAPGYIDPLREPARFLDRLGASLGILVTNGALALDLGLGAVGGAYALLGAALFVATITICTRGKERRLAWTLALGGALAFVPTAAAPYGSRLLLLPSVGFVGAAALALAGVVESIRGGALRAGAPARGLAAIGAILALALGAGHLPRAAAASYGETARTRDLSKLLVDAALGAPPPGDRTRVLLAAPDPFARMYAPLVARWAGRGAATGWYPLSPHHLAHELRRVDDRTLEIRVRAPFARAPFVDGIDPRALVGRAAVRTGPLSIVALQVEPETRLRVRFDEPLERYQLLIFSQRTYVEVPPPAIGQRRLAGPVR